MSSYTPNSRKPNLAAYLLRQLLPTDNMLLLGMAVIVGLATAFALWLFRLTIEVFHELFIVELAGHSLLFAGSFHLVIALAFAGLIVGLIKQRFVGQEKYHGVAGIMEAVALSGGHLRYRIMPFKATASALSLGAGASVGPEDPSVQIGCNLGSFFGDRFHLGEETTRLLVAAGAASAISSAFNAPIAGVFFALEVILHGELATGSVSVIILAAVICTGITQGLELGEGAMGPFDFTLGSMMEVPFYAPLGVLLAPFAIAFIRGAYFQHDLWHRIRVSAPLKTALAGAIVGFVGIYFPEIMGAGREVMNHTLRGEMDYALLTLLALAVVKMVMTNISIAGGFVGGIFAPALFIGTMLGALYGNFLTNTLGLGLGDSRAFAIAGMAGMMAGVVRAPITAIMMVFELTNDYRFILPIMLVSVVCILIAERFEKHGIYELSLIRQGIWLTTGRDVDLMQGITVAEAMTTPPPAIHKDATLLELRDSLRRQHRNGLCVVDDDGKLYGIVTLSDLQNAYSSNGDSNVRVGDICVREVATALPDDALWRAIRNMGARHIGRLPVIDPVTGELVGLVSRHDVVEAYNTAIQRKLQDQQRAEQIRLNTLTGAHVYEMYVRQGSALVGKLIQDVTWPPETVVASIIRKGKLIVPHGNTMIRQDDVLMMVADPHSELALMDLFGQKGPT